MPKVFIAKPVGFCFGVERAIRLAKEGLAKWRRVYTYGELVHNPLVVKELRNLGIKELRNLRDLAAVDDGALVIRAHGCPPNVLLECERLNIRVIDATCPYVQRVQNVAQKLTEEGYQVVVVGERNHPEVKAILAASGKNAEVYPPKRKNRNKKIGIVAQTTIDRNCFRESVANLISLGYNEIRVFDTVCAEAVARQKATMALVKRVDGVIVVGGRNSANTKRLAEIVFRSGKPVVHIVAGEELDVEEWRQFNKVGIVGGASTPAQAVAEIARLLKNFQLPPAEGRKSGEEPLAWRASGGFLQTLSLRPGTIEF